MMRNWGPLHPGYPKPAATEPGDPLRVALVGLLPLLRAMRDGNGMLDGDKTLALYEGVEAAERALAAGPVEVTIEPWDPNSGMSRICVDGLDHMAVDADAVRVATVVAEALGARVVRR